MQTESRITPPIATPYRVFNQRCMIMSNYEKEFRVIDNKIEMSFSKPYESAYGAIVKLTASEAREVARKLSFYADELDSALQIQRGE